MKKSIFIILLSVFIQFEILAHPWKPDHYVIIETDCGLDDFRAINLLLSSPNVRVLAIIASNGVIGADEGYSKIKALLKELHHEGIMIGINNSLPQCAKNCKPALDFNWGAFKGSEGELKPSYIDVVGNILNTHQGKITFVSLGSLNSVATCLKEMPLFDEKVNNVIWAANYNDLQGSFNYMLDENSFKSVRNSNITISIVNGNTPNPEYNSDFINQVKVVKSKYANEFCKSLQIKGSPFALRYYDELVPVFIEHQRFFTCDTISETIRSYELSLETGSGVLKSVFIQLLLDNAEIHNQVLSKFPLDTSNYIADIKEIVAPTIDRFGKEEWIASVLTSELHRHLGVYSLIGAKMGIRAREYFGAGVDEMEIISYAGTSPPFSCLNDGLQVSTGATLGHGLIRVKDSLQLPLAEFTYLGKKIQISLKDEYRKKIASEIKELSFIYGLDSNIYWDLVRGLAIKYWKSWDRHEIFEISEQNLKLKFL